jgi:pyrophosphatase PpaX
MAEINTILFDLDGTLINTNNIIIESFRKAFQDHFPDLKMTNEKILTFIGPTLHQTFSKYTGDYDVIEAMIKSYRQAYVELEVGNHDLYPNVLEVLNKLKREGFNLGIVTSKFREAAWPSFTHYKMDTIFDCFVSLDDVEEPKPSRNPIDVALGHFDEVTGAIMIGDNQGDILAGKNAGIFSAGVSWSIKGKTHLMEVNPDYMLETMDDIFQIIEDIKRKS